MEIGVSAVVPGRNEQDTNTYMLFTGREVRIGKNCARGLEYGPRPQAEGRTRDRGHSFSQYGPTKAGE